MSLKVGKYNISLEDTYPYKIDFEKVFGSDFNIIWYLATLLKVLYEETPIRLSKEIIDKYDLNEVAVKETK